MKFKEWPRSLRISYFCWAGVAAIYLVNMLVNVITDSPGTGTGFFMVVLAGAGASSTQMISTGKRGGRTAATVLGVLLILLSIVGIVLVIALDVLAPGFAVVVAILTAAVIALVVTACMFLYKPDVNAILTT